jgi:hypothetical protein
MDILNNNYRFQVSPVRFDGTNFELNIFVTINDETTDSNIMFMNNHLLRQDELHQIINSYKYVLNGINNVFSFVSSDKKLVFWVKKQSEAFIHKFIIHSNAGRKENVNVCKLHLLFAFKDVEKLIQGIVLPSSCDIEYRNIEGAFSNNLVIEFPKVVEFVDSGLCVCSILVSSTHFRVLRKFDTNIKDIIYYKSQIEKCKEGKLLAFDFVTDFLEIYFKKRNSLIEIEGTISDFLWPEPNEITFHETVDETFLAKIYASLCCLQEQIVLHQFR